MPQPLKIDWDLAKALFLQGVPDKVIAEKVGAKAGSIQCRATRHNWRSERDRAAEIVQSEVGKTAVRYLSRDLASIASELREGMAEDARETMLALRQNKPNGKSLDQLAQREQVAGALVKRAWQTLGLDQAGNNTVVNVAILGNLSDHDAEAQSGHTIDVSATVTTAVKDETNQSPS